MAVEVITWVCVALGIVGLASWGVFCALTGRIQ